MEMPSPWSYSSVPSGPEIGSISPAGLARAAGPDGAGPGIGAVEEEVALLDRPAVVAAEDDAVDLLDVVLADVGQDQIAVDAVEGEAIRIAQSVGVDLRHLARPLERVGRRDAVLAVAADGIGAAGGQGRVQRVDPQHLAQSGVLRFWALPPGSMWLGADVVGVAAVAQSPDTDSRPGRRRSCRRCDCPRSCRTR